MGGPILSIYRHGKRCSYSSRDVGTAVHGHVHVGRTRTYQVDIINTLAANTKMKPDSRHRFKWP